MCPRVCVCVSCAYNACKGQKRASDSWTTVIVSFELPEVLGTEPGPSRRTVSALNDLSISPTLVGYF